MSLKPSCDNRASDAEAGFTLLEVIIAMAIMVISFASILAVESGSINASARARQMNIVAMLAKQKMVQTETQLQGKKFEEAKKEDGGDFDEPYKDYRWASAIKEVEFPSLNVTASGGKGDDKKQDSGGNEILEKITKLLTKFLSKSIREVSVTIFWKRGSGEQSFTVSTYWVNLNQEFELQE